MSLRLSPYLRRIGPQLLSKPISPAWLSCSPASAEPVSSGCPSHLSSFFPPLLNGFDRRNDQFCIEIFNEFTHERIGLDSRDGLRLLLLLFTILLLSRTHAGNDSH